MKSKDLVIGQVYAIAPRYAGRGVSLDRTSPGRLLEIATRKPSWGLPEHRVMMLTIEGHEDRERHVYSKDIMAPWEEAEALVKERIEKVAAYDQRKFDREIAIGKVVDRLPGNAVGIATGRETENRAHPYPITLRLDDVALSALTEAMAKVGMIL